MKRQLCFLRLGADYLDDARLFDSVRAALTAYREEAQSLARFGQALDGSLHYVDTLDESPVEYPDFILSLSPRGCVVKERG